MLLSDKIMLLTELKHPVSVQMACVHLVPADTQCSPFCGGEGGPAECHVVQLASSLVNGVMLILQSTHFSMTLDGELLNI